MDTRMDYWDFFSDNYSKLMAIFLKGKEIVLFKKDKLFAQVVIKLYKL